MMGLLEELAAQVTELAAAVAELRAEHQPALLDKRGAAELLSLTPQAIETLSKRGKLPRVTLPNGRVRYEREALLTWARGGAS